MKAAYYSKYGSPDVIEIKELPKPTPKANEVLIKIKATTVNRTDCETRSAAYFVMRFFTGFFGPRRKIMGSDFAGEVEAVGENTTKYKVGDKVVGFNDEGIQSHAEYLALKEKHVYPMAQNVSFEDAAASLEGVHYAINGMTKMGVQAGQKVLVYGASGAIGSASVQLLKVRGLEVTAVCGTEDIDAIKSMNPDRVIDYKVTDYWKEDKEYDYVIDAVGKSSFEKSKQVLAEKGIYISSELGEGAENLYLPLVTKIKGGKRVMFPIPQKIGRSIKEITKLLEEGKYKPLIDRVYPFAEIIDANRYVEKGFKVGNVVIKY